MLDKLKELFGGGHDHDRERHDEALVQRPDRRGTGDETPEHPPTVFAQPEEAGHTPDPVVAGGHVHDDTALGMAEERRGESVTGAPVAAERGVPATDRGTSEGARMRREGQGDLDPADQRWVAGDKAPLDSAYHPDPPNRNPARDKGRSLGEEAEILANDIVGQKPTTEGTAGHDWKESPQNPEP